MKMIAIVVALLSALVLVGFALGFRREHVLSADGLVGVRAEHRGNTLLITGSIFASGAGVKKVTTTSSDGDVLVRVYVDRVTPETMAQATGKFCLSLSLSAVRSVRIGENSRLITIGHVFSVPLRIPRIPSGPVTDRVLWAKGSGTTMKRSGPHRGRSCNDTWTGTAFHRPLANRHPNSGLVAVLPAEKRRRAGDSIAATCAAKTGAHFESVVRSVSNNAAIRVVTDAAR